MIDERDLSLLCSLMGKHIARVFLIVWPPEGEDRLIGVDISLGFELSDTPSQLIVISISRNDNWTPEVRLMVLTGFLPSAQFDSRISDWMHTRRDGVFELQCFDFSLDARFSEFVGKPIKGIELISAENEPEPFGVRILIDGDSLIVVPISDGATVITSQFGDRSALECFADMGQISYLAIA